MLNALPVMVQALGPLPLTDWYAVMYVVALGVITVAVQ